MTVRYVHPTDGYATIAAAIAAASAGDVIVLASGSYAGADVGKAVHIVAEAQTYGSVTITSSLRYLGALGGPLLLEGLQLTQGIDLRNAGGAVRVWLNRCGIGVLFSGFGVGLGKGYSASAKVRLENCARHNTSYTGLFLDSKATDQVELVRCQVPGIIPCGFCSAYPTVITEDWVAPPTAGYGPAYGTWYSNQFIGQVVRVAGTAALEVGDAVEDVQVLLYRETAYQSGRIEATRWMETAPDPVSGAWQFAYLPTTDASGDPQRYAVVLNPPACYPPEIKRWYPVSSG
jgi:hypothetical protein